MIFMGYSLEQKGYKYFNPSSRQTRVNRDVVFDEAASWYAPASINVENEPSGSSNLSWEDESWISVATDIDLEKGARSLEMTRPEPSSNRNTARNEGETSHNQRSRWKNKGRMPTRKNAIAMSDTDSDNSKRSTDRERR